MTDKYNEKTTFDQHLRNVLPIDSPLRRALRRLKMDLNEMLWAVKPDLPQIGDTQELHQLRRLISTSAVPDVDPQGKRILIFSMRSWRIHKIWEGLIGRGLLERGAKPTVIICDGLPRCDMFTMDMPGYSNIHCRACISYTRQIFHLFGLPIQSISDFLQAADHNIARDLVTTWGGNYQDFEAEGLHLGELVRPSLMRTLLRGSMDEDPRSIQLYREYLEGGVLLARALQRLLDQLQPDTLVMLNGMFFAERIGLALAQIQGLHTVTHERGFMRNSLVMSHDEPANWFRVDGAWETVKDTTLTPEQDSALDEYLMSRQGKGDEVVNYWPSIESRHDFIIQQLALDPDKPIVTVFTNILWDTAVYKRDVAFDGMFDWLKYTIDQVSELPELQLVIRVHPAEVRLKQQTRERVIDRLAELYTTLPANITIVPPESDLSSYALIDLSSAISVYTSTIGLEAAVRKMPVLVSGETHYRGKGFTYDVTSKLHYKNLVHQIQTGISYPLESVSMAKSYAHLFFLGNMLPIDLVTEFENGSVQFNIDTFDALTPNQHYILDHICTAILEKRDFALQ